MLDFSELLAPIQAERLELEPIKNYSTDEFDETPSVIPANSVISLYIVDLSDELLVSEFLDTMPSPVVIVPIKKGVGWDIDYLIVQGSRVILDKNISQNRIRECSLCETPSHEGRYIIAKPNTKSFSNKWICDTCTQELDEMTRPLFRENTTDVLSLIL